MFITPAQCRMARAAVRWTRLELADKAGVSEASVKNLEDERTVATVPVMAKIRSAFEEAGVMFLEPRDGGYGVMEPRK